MSGKGLRDSKRRRRRPDHPKTALSEESLYRLIADTSATWEYLEDPDGRVLWVSPSCEAISGRPPEEFLKDPGLLLAIVHPADRPLFESHRRECLRSDDREETAFRIVRPDGGVRWIGHQCRPLGPHDARVAGRRSSNREITRRMEAEEQLLRLNRTLRALSDSNHALLHARVESNLLEDICRIVVEDCGHAMAWIGFAEADEAKAVRPVAQAGIETGYLDALNVSWADAGRGCDPTGTAIRTGEAVTCRNMSTVSRFAPWREEALKHGYASSIAIPLMADGKTIGTITICSKEADRFSEEETKLLCELAANLSHGISAIRLRTSHLAAEQELMASEHRYRSLFESMDEGFVACEAICDAAGTPSDFRCLSVNPAFARLTGVPLESAAGKTFRELVPNLEPFWIEALGRVVESGRSERFDGWVADLGKHYEVFAWRSDVGRLAVLFTDVTERKRAEAGFRDLNETLERRVAERTAEAKRQAEQLKVLASELSQTERRERLRLAGALHDHLQQLLVAAKLNLDALPGRLGDDRLRTDVARVEQLLDQSIAWCRSATVSLSPPILQVAGLAPALGWLVRQMQEQYGFRLALSIGDEWVEPVDADLKTFLFEVVRELVINVGRRPGEQAVRVRLGRGDGNLEIRVESEGSRLDAEALAEQVEDGEHFRLFAVRQRLETVGGSLSVEIVPGEGMRITLRVPGTLVPARSEAVADPPAAGETDEAPEPERTRSGRVRVLIADDHKIFRQGFRALLRVEEAIEVVGEAADGAEAVELARILRPDVVIMDVSMPKMNGIEATRLIVAELPGVRVVGLSMHEDDEIAASMREAGAVGFLTKGGPSDAAISAIQAAHVAGKNPK